MIKDESFQKCKHILFRKSFPYYLVNRLMIYGAIILYKLNLKDVAYIFDLLNSLYTDHSKCSSTEIEKC